MTGSLHVKRGVWWTAIHTGSGQYQWKSTGLPERGNKTEAKRILRQRIEECERQDGVVWQDIYFHDFMLDWLDIVATQVKANTLHQYELIIKNSIIPFFEKSKIRLRELQPLHIQKYYVKKMKDGCSGNTVKHHHNNIRKALNYALRQNWIPYNPADRVELPRVEPYVGNFYTAPQLQRILALVRGTVIETPVLLSVTYGLRRSEAIGLKWDAVDFEHQTLTIRHTVTGTGKNRVCEDRTKTKSSRRSLYLLPEVAAHLQIVRQRQAEMQALLKNQYHSNGYICTWEDGRLISPEYLSRKFHEILMEEHGESGLPVYRYHDLRHSSASLLVGEGKSLKQVGEWLGHSSPATTNRYAHLQFQSTVEMADTVSQKLFAG